jgi:hypothetical protein
MYKNTHEITSLDKQIILLSKNWFADYLESNKIELSSIEILKHMIAKYVGSEPQYITTNNVYWWVSRLYSYLSDSGLFPELSTNNLLERFTRILNPFWKTEKSQEEDLIENLLGGISMTEGVGLDALEIKLGEPDFTLLDGIRCIKNGLELIESANDDECVVFKTSGKKGDFLLSGGSVDKVMGYYKCEWATSYYSDNVDEIDFKDVRNIRYVKKSEVKIKSYD